jgi:hypothetical protein
MKPTEISVMVKAKRSVESKGQWKSFGLEYGVSATLEPGENIDVAIPALDAQIRDLIGQSDGFKAKKKLVWKEVFK